MPHLYCTTLVGYFRLWRWSKRTWDRSADAGYPVAWRLCSDPRRDLRLYFRIMFLFALGCRSMRLARWTSLRHREQPSFGSSSEITKRSSQRACEMTRRSSWRRCHDRAPFFRGRVVAENAPTRRYDSPDSVLTQCCDDASARSLLSPRRLRMSSPLSKFRASWIAKSRSASVSLLDSSSDDAAPSSDCGFSR